nr:hypothetical protein [Rhodococcus sp. (in: high G+C Gram-positive bacteria)]
MTDRNTPRGLGFLPDEPYSEPRRYWRKVNLMRVLSQANGNPPVLKQLLQFLLFIVYPAWVFYVAVCAVCFFAAWVLFWPMRRYQAKHHPEEAAQAQARRLA